MEHFVGRERELAFLEGKYRQRGAQLIVLYGRRRVGKTFLLQRFIRGKKHVYYLCSKDKEEEQIKLISRKWGEALDDDSLRLNPFAKWGELFEYLAGRVGKRRVVFVIDEFPFLVAANPAAVSLFQKFWDERLSTTGLYLVLCGSSMAMMERDVLSYKSPLYGRRTGQWKLKPFAFAESAAMFPKTDIEEMIRYYAVTGGVPFYLTKFDLHTTARENIVKNVFKKGEVLYDEGESLLRQELSEPATYLAILKAVAAGNTRQSDIANAAGMEATSLPRFLSSLINLGIVERTVPVTEKARSKKSLYTIGDHFFRFWFTFVYPNRSDLEEGNETKLEHLLDSQFNGFVGRVFEDVCAQFVRTLELPLSVTKVGRWWEKDREIDVVCLDEINKKALFVECKWSRLREAEARKVVMALKEKAAAVRWERKAEFFGLIAKNVEGKQKLRSEGFLVFDLADIKTVLKKKRPPAK